MEPVQELGPWVALVRDLVIPTAVMLLTIVLRRKFGVELALKRREKIATVAFDALMYAYQLARSRHHPEVANSIAGLQSAAREFLGPKLPEPERAEALQQIEAWLGKLNYGLVVVPTASAPDVHAAQTVPDGAVAAVVAP